MPIQRCLLQKVDEGQSVELQRMFQAWRTKAFDDVELLRALANRPELMKVIFAFMKYLYVDASIEPTLMEMLRIKSAWTAKCRHWSTVRSASGKQKGLTEEAIQKMRDYENSDLPDREKMALRFADIILGDPQKLDEVFFKRMKEHFTEEQIIDMGMGVGFLHGTQRFIESMGIVPESYNEGAYCELPFSSRL